MNPLKTAKHGLLRLFTKVMLTGEQLLHMTCRQFIRRASDKYDRRLLFYERILQALHRGICHICQLQERRMDQLHALAHEIGHDAGEAGPTQLDAKTRERIRSAMERAGRG